MTGKILMSACLMGLPVRYDGKPKTLLHEAVARWKAEGRLVSFCPELAGGFAVPRPPAEIAGALDGRDVLVNDEDAAIRANRLALLSAIRSATGTVADFSKIAG